MAAPDGFDVLILGAGAGAKLIWSSVPGRSVGVVERSRVGGECPFVACVPGKAMLRSARAWELAADPQFAPLFTGRVPAAEAYRQAVRRRDTIVRGRDDGAAASALAKSGATLLRGVGRIVAPGAVEVGGERVGYGDLVLNTGSYPVVPDVPGLASVPTWTSDELLSAAEQPSSAVVLGGGPVGCELAFLLATFGTAVTLVQRNGRLVPREEPEASETLARALTERGVRVLLDARARRATGGAAGARLELEDGRAVDAERVVLATGRRPRAAELGLDVLGVTPGPTGAVPVDDRCRVVGADRVWAVGDVTGVAPFTHTAHYQGRVVAANLSGREVRADYRAVPRAVYAEPVLAAVGHTEASARASGIDPLIAGAAVGEAVRSVTEGAAAGWVKLIADPGSGTLVGATAMGGQAEEWISEVSLALRAGVPVRVFADVVHPFPTFGELLERPLWELSGRLRDR